MPLKGKHAQAFGRSRDRFKLLLYPLCIALAFRVMGAVLLFETLSPEGSFHTPWMSVNPNLIPMNWLWLFNAWDSLQFPRIAMYGYVHPNYVYLPAYPILIYLAGRLTGDFWFGAFLIAQIFALASIVVFQLLAEQYMQPREALHATLLMAAFPFINVFTILSYSEPIFLFSTIAAWYFHKRGQNFTSSLLAAIASLTRIYGFTILLPILVDNVKSKRYRHIPYLAIPVTLMGAWALFCYRSTGDLLASWTDQKYWIQLMNQPSGNGVRLMEALLHQGLRGVMLCCSGVDPTIFYGVGLFVILTAMVWRIDRVLWTYPLGISVLLLLTTTYYLSLLRYFAFIFPIWLTIRVRNPLAAAICIAFLIPISLIVWLYAIAITFIG